MPNASFPPAATNVISSRNPLCFRSRGMTSLSRVWVKSFPCFENIRDSWTKSHLSQQGNDFPFQSLGEVGYAALQMHGDFACKHGTLLGSRCQGGDSDNYYWFRYSENSLSLLTILS